MTRVMLLCDTSLALNIANSIPHASRRDKAHDLCLPPQRGLNHRAYFIRRAP